MGVNVRWQGRVCERTCERMCERVDERVSDRVCERAFKRVGNIPCMVSAVMTSGYNVCMRCIR